MPKKVRITLTCYELADIYMSLVVMEYLGKKELEEIKQKLGRYIMTKCAEGD